MDGVVADFENHFMDVWKKRYPNEFFVPFEERKAFKIKDDYPSEVRDKIRAIYHEQNFFLNLPVIDGAKEAIETLKNKGHTLFFCTSPLSDFKYSVIEKYIWVGKNFGPQWRKKIILTKDKTMIKGDILIDDKPEITGEIEPEWEHVLYDSPYNRATVGKRRINWWNYEKLFE